MAADAGMEMAAGEAIAASIITVGDAAISEAPTTADGEAAGGAGGSRPKRGRRRCRGPDQLSVDGPLTVRGAPKADLRRWPR